jgi:hypothetical protein
VAALEEVLLVLQVLFSYIKDMIICAWDWVGDLKRWEGRDCGKGGKG